MRTRLKSHWSLTVLAVLGLGMAAIALSTNHQDADEVDEATTDPTERQLVRQCRDSLFVVQGRVTVVESTEHPEARTVSLGTIEITRHLKGASDLRTIPVEFRFDSDLDMRPDTEDVIWFVRERKSNGRYPVTDWKWGIDSLDRIMDVVARVDRTPIPSMPNPGAADESILDQH